MKYTNCVLRKGKRVIQVLVYIAPSDEAHKAPSGGKRGYYACDVNGKTKYIMTHNISRYVRLYNFTVEPMMESYLHAHHSIKHQENVTEKTEGLWKRFWNFITK